MRRPERSVECSDSEKKMSACADQNHAPSLTCVRLEYMIVQFANGKKVEIQLRTIGMDFWSVLEYQLQYKKHHKKGKQLKEELFSCAIDVRNMDQRMLDLRQSIENV